ncbi:MAG TPA: sugar transferase [Actinomycetota bacterium]|nr:sugar transferase [Actinomycetota bacterium]
MAQTVAPAQISPEPAGPPQTRPRRGAKRVALRVLADALAVTAALFTASVVRFELLTGAPAKGVDYTLITLLATPLWIGLFWLYGLYEPRQVLGPVNEFKQVFHGVVAGTVVVFIADSAININLARGWAFVAMMCGFVFVGGERLLVRKTLHFMRRRGGDTTRTIVLGANHEGQTVARTLEREGWLGYKIVGFVDDDLPPGHELSPGHVVIGSTSEVKNLIINKNASLVLIAASAFDTARLNRMFWELQDTNVDLQITSGTIDLLASRMIVQSVAGVPLLYVRRTGMDKIQQTMKRTLDVAGSALGLLLLSPVLIAMAAWIKKDSEGGAFFKQTRVGREGKLFTVWKFRTMVADAEDKLAELEHLSEGPGLLFKLKEDPRITKAGKALRRYSLDELPQLWNVLRGEMSLVGPRPALPSEVEQYDDWVRNRLKVKPGMTGLWQVSGRTETSFSDYVRYDLFYIQNWSISLDLWILWRTFRAVTTAEGAH